MNVLAVCNIQLGSRRSYFEGVIDAKDHKKTPAKHAA